MGCAGSQVIAPVTVDVERQPAAPSEVLYFAELCLAYPSFLEALVNRPALDEIELLRIELAEHPRRDEPLDQAGEPTARFPRGLDSDKAMVPGRIDDEAGHGPLLLVRLRQH